MYADHILVKGGHKPLMVNFFLHIRKMGLDNIDVKYAIVSNNVNTKKCILYYIA